MKPIYDFIEHTADVGIRVKGKDLKDLFRNAALAMFDIIAEDCASKQARQKELSIKLSADNPEELFIDWLNELLSLSSAKGLIFFRVSINKLDENNLQAKVNGLENKECRVNVEIKAATYHELKLKKTKSGYSAEVIFDV